MLDSGRRHRFAAAVSMFDEEFSMRYNVEVRGHEFVQMEVVQSSLIPYERLQDALAKHPCGHYTLLENLDKRKREEVLERGERFDWGARSISRNFNHAFGALRDGGIKFDYAIGMYGDTAILHFWGIEQICAKMEATGAEVACSRAMGQSFHRADLTSEEMDDNDNQKCGRFQDESNRDFMPHLWVVSADAVRRFCNIQITNRWCIEQCLGDAAGDAPMVVFSKTAYGFNDGIIYNVPSPMGWQHKGGVEAFYDTPPDLSRSHTLLTLK
jgi:hypothetical protein